MNATNELAACRLRVEADVDGAGTRRSLLPRVPALGNTALLDQSLHRQSPDPAWVCQQARNFLIVAEEMELPPKILMRDNDAKLSKQVDEAFTSGGVEIKRTTPMSPNLRAHVERFIQSLKHECLNKFVIVAPRHLNHVNAQWLLHYNRERPHSAKDHLPPACESPPEPSSTIPLRDVVCHTRLGGLLKSYERRAA